MSNLYDLLALLALGAGIGGWMKLSAARERAVGAVRRICGQRDLQLLDETVGLRRLRLRRVNGQLTLERCYDFEVSLDGHDREPGRLWMVGATVASVSLPARETLPPARDDAPPAAGRGVPEAASNVVLLSSRRRGSPNDLMH